MGLFYSSPSKPNFFRIGRGAPLSMRPPKKPRNTALTWFPKLLNRIRALPQNLALGMKTHSRALFSLKTFKESKTPEIIKTQMESMVYQRQFKILNGKEYT